MAMDVVDDRIEGGEMQCFEVEPDPGEARVGEAGSTLGVGLFGREGVVMQALEGDALAFVHACGTVLERERSAHETLLASRTCAAAPQDAGLGAREQGGLAGLFGGDRE